MKYYWESEENFGSFDATSDSQAMSLAESRAMPDRLLSLEMEFRVDSDTNETNFRKIFPIK